MKFFITHIMVACALVMLILVSCDDDCPTCPSPPTDPVSDYNVYLHGLINAPIYVYNTQEMALVDTMDFGDITGMISMAVSGNGRHLIMAIDNSPVRATMVIDIETRDTVAILGFGQWLEVSNTGKYLVIIDVADLYIYECGNYSLVLHDAVPEDTDRGSFLFDDSKFYCVANGYYVRIYDMASQSLDTVFQYFDNDDFSPAIYDVQPNPEGDKLYLTCWYPPYNHYLVAYSLINDSTTLKYFIGPPAGDLQLTPDGEQLLYTDPGNVFFEEFGSMHVIFIDPETDAIISIVDAGRSVMNETSDGFPPGQIAFTPDSRYSVVACSMGGPAFGMIDNQLHRFVDVSLFEIQSVAFATCQKAPK